jgi:hypothetical protein
MQHRYGLIAFAYLSSLLLQASWFLFSCAAQRRQLAGDCRARMAHNRDVLG